MEDSKLGSGIGLGTSRGKHSYKASTKFLILMLIASFPAILVCPDHGSGPRLPRGSVLRLSLTAPSFISVSSLILNIKALLQRFSTSAPVIVSSS
jgi:hypothetical protein